MYKKYRTVTIEEFNKLLDYVKTIREIVYDHPNPLKPIGRYAYVDEHQTKIELTFKEGKTACTYVTRLDGAVTKDDPDVNGGLAFSIGQKYYKVPEYPGDKYFSAKPYLYYNEKYEWQRVHAYMYDINSAYATVMANYKFPDTSVEPHDGIVGPNEIGFTREGELMHEGHYATFIFPLMESPYKKFVEVWYQKKKNAATKKERNTAKAVLNFYVGMLQRHNCFLRAYIVYSCTELIKSKCDEENTLMSNTDSIVSLVPLDLKIGDELGEWKFEEGEIAYIKYNYQWNDELPKYRGIPRGWFKPGWDILKDDAPSFGNLYRFDYDENQIKEELEVL